MWHVVPRHPQNVRMSGDDRKKENKLSSIQFWGKT